MNETLISETLASEVRPLAKNQFASDNLSGVTPETWSELERANQGHAQAYGNDSWTNAVSEMVRELFEMDCDVYFTFNGTAANSLILPANGRHPVKRINYATEVNNERRDRINKNNAQAPSTSIQR